MSVSEIHAAARQPVKDCSKASSGCPRTLRSVNRRFPFQLGNLGYAPSGFIIASSARHIPFPIIPTSSDSSYGPHDARITRRTSRPHVSNNSTYSCSSRLLPLPLSAPCSLAPNAELAFTITFYVYGHVPSFNLMGFKLFHSPSSLAFVWPPPPCISNVLTYSLFLVQFGLTFYPPNAARPLGLPVSAATSVRLRIPN